MPCCLYLSFCLVVCARARRRCGLLLQDCSWGRQIQSVFPLHKSSKEGSSFYVQCTNSPPFATSLYQHVFHLKWTWNVCSTLKFTFYCIFSKCYAAHSSYFGPTIRFQHRAISAVSQHLMKFSLSGLLVPSTFSTLHWMPFHHIQFDQAWVECPPTWLQSIHFLIVLFHVTFFESLHMSMSFKLVDLFASDVIMILSLL